MMDWAVRGGARKKRMSHNMNHKMHGKERICMHISVNKEG